VQMLSKALRVVLEFLPENGARGKRLEILEMETALNGLPGRNFGADRTIVVWLIIPVMWKSLVLMGADPTGMGRIIPGLMVALAGKTPGRETIATGQTIKDNCGMCARLHDARRMLHMIQT